MLISLREIDSRQALEAALEAPICKEDHAFYATGLPEAARALAKRKLPCIFVEQAGQQGAGENAGVYGVDLILQEEEPGVPILCRMDDIFLARLWQRHYGLPWTISQTERLCIRESVMEDLPAFLAMYGEETDNPDVTPFPDRAEEALYLYIKQQYPLYGYGLWTIVERQTGAVAGRIGVENDKSGGWQLAYLIARQYRRRGYAGEAAGAVLTYARDMLELPYLKLHTSAANTASQKMAVSLGFRKLSISENSYIIDLTSR